MKPLTIEQHQQILERLLALVKRPKQNDFKNITHEQKLYYVILIGFLKNSISITETLLNILKSCNNLEDFPVFVGYILTRPLFEMNVNARYIAKNPEKYTKQYINYLNIIQYKRLTKIEKHQNSNKDDWKEEIASIISEYAKSNKIEEITNKFIENQLEFSSLDKEGKRKTFSNWSGKSLYQMANDEVVDCKEPYDILYSELSSLTHVDVSILTKFVKKSETGNIYVNLKAKEIDVNKVLRYAIMFFTDFLKIFGQELNTWGKKEVDECWEV
jgi:hypothetical protein